jgi:hypothetical protein
MANLFPKHTGLPFVVWISVRGGARHDVRVKVSASAKAPGPVPGPVRQLRAEIGVAPRYATPSEMTTVGICPEVRLIEGRSIPSLAFDQLKQWIELNRATLLSYWDGDIDTQDALDALAKVE